MAAPHGRGGPPPPKVDEKKRKRAIANARAGGSTVQQNLDYNTTSSTGEAPSIATVQHHSTSQVPVLTKLALAGLTDRQKDLVRATRLAARAYDVTPRMVLGSDYGNLRSPITGDELSIKELERLAGSGVGALSLLSFMQKGIKANNQTRKLILAHGVKGDEADYLNAKLSNKKVMALFGVIGNGYREEKIKATQGMALAFSVAEDVKPDVLASNIDAIKRWTKTGVEASWKQQLGMAVAAAKQGVVLRDVEDVVRFTSFIGGASGAHIDALKAQGISASDIKVAEDYNKRVNEIAATGGQLPPIPEAFTRLASAGVDPSLLIAGEEVRDFSGDIEDYFKDAEGLKERLAVNSDAWENSWVNRFVVHPAMTALDKANRGFEMGAITAFGGLKNTDLGKMIQVSVSARDSLFGDDPVEIDPVAKVNLDQYSEDIQAAWHGETRLADTLVRDWNIPRWQAEGMEFVAGWYLDPLIIGGKLSRAVTLSKVNPEVLTKLRNAGEGASRMGRYTDRAEGFVQTHFDDFARAMASSDDLALGKFADPARWRTVMGQTPFDTIYLEKVREEMKVRGLLGKPLTTEVRDELREVMLGQFMPGLPTPGGLADFGFRARQAEVETARKAYTAAPTDAKKILELGKAQDALMAEKALDPASVLPHRLEIPSLNRPIPGFGLVKTAGNTFTGALGDTALGRNLRKLPNINPGGILKIHSEPEQWFQRQSVRGGWKGSEVDRWTTEARQAAASAAPEVGLQSLLSRFETETMYRFTRPARIPDEVADEMLKVLGGKSGKGLASKAGELDPVFGATSEVRFLDDGTPYVTRSRGGTPITQPTGQSELTNFLPTIDPIDMQHAVTEYTGVVRKMRNAVIKSEDPAMQQLVKAGAFNARNMYEHSVEPLARLIVKTFKLGAVARPAYMFRVVLGDELLRALATNQSVFEQAMSYGWWTKTILDVPTPERGPVRRVLGPLAERLDEAGHRRIAAFDVDLSRAGSRLNEPLANTQLNVAELAVASQKDVERKLALLRSAPEYKVLSPGEAGHLPAWEYALNRVMGNSPGMTEGLRFVGSSQAKNADEVIAHLREWATTPEGRKEMARIGATGPQASETWARNAGGMVYSYTMGDANLARMAELRSVTADDLLHFRKEIQLGEERVWGRPYVHGPDLDKASHGVDGLINRTVDRWYGLWVRGPENMLNRQPYYHQFQQRAEAAMASAVGAEKMADPAVARAVELASRDFALANSKKIMFDFTENSRAGELLSFAFPFIQPWQENFTVWGHILTKRNPAMIGYVNRVAQVGVDSGFIHKDADGTWVIPETWFAFTMPFLWAIGGPAGKIGPQGEQDSTAGLPVLGRVSSMYSLSTGITSLNLFANSTLEVGGVPIPAPGLSPWAAYPLQKWFSSMDTSEGWRASLGKMLFAFGPGPENVAEGATDALIPRWLRTAVGAVPGLNALFGEDERLEQVTSDYLELQERLGQEVDVDRARNQARMDLLYRGVTAALFPGAVKISYPHTYLEDEYHAKIDELGGNAAGITGARDYMHEKYPEYDLITIPKTTSARVSNWMDADGNEYLDLFGQNTVSPPGVRPAASTYAAQVVKQPGFKEFASDPETAMWAMALVFQAGNPKADEFDMSAYAETIQRGDIRTRAAQEVYDDLQEFRFFEAWDPIDKTFDKEYAKAEKAGGYAGDKGPYDDVSDRKALELADLASQYDQIQARFLSPRDGGGYSFTFDNQGQWPDGVHPAILHSAQLVLASDVVADFPAVNGLRQYMGYRNALRRELVNKGLDGLEDTRALKYKKQYKAKVDAILSDSPEFELFYNTWFQNDLRYDLPTKGEELVDKWRREADAMPIVEDPLAGTRAALQPGRPDTAKPKPTNYSRYESFREGYLAFRDKIAEAKAAGETDVDPGAVYQSRTAYVNRWFGEHPNIVKAYLNSQSAAEREAAKANLMTDPMVFYDRVDWYTAGFDLSNRAAKWLEQVQATNTAISAWEERYDLTRGTGDKRQEVAQFISSHLGEDKSFDRAVDAMNTWGFGATLRGWDQGDSSSAKAWRAIMGYANKTRVLAEEANIHGDDQPYKTFDHDGAVWYNNERDNLGNYVDVLRKWSPQFEKQWQTLSDSYSGSKFIEWLQPKIWFKSGDTDPFGSASSAEQGETVKTLRPLIKQLAPEAPILGSNLKPAGKAHVGGRKLATDRGVTLAVQPLKSLEAAQKELGIPLFNNIGGYRTRAQQADLYANRGSNPNPVAAPGTSNHERGTAIDVDSAFMGAHPEFRKWLTDHGWVNLAGDPPHWDYRP